MPAGDAGRPYGTPAEENAWDVANELRTENARLQAQAATMQTVVDRARELVEIDPGVWVRPDWAEANRQLIVAIRALDAAQTAQPEGEPR